MSGLSRFRFIQSIFRPVNFTESFKPATTSHIIVTRNLSDDIIDQELSSTRLENVDNFKCINRVTLLGRATGPAIVQMLGNSKMASFTLATNELRRNRSNELIKHSEFHKIQVFMPRMIEKTKHVIQKGSRVLVEGKIKYNVRKGEHGNIHFTNITADNIVFITGNRMNANQVDEEVEEIEEEIVEEEKQQAK